MYGSRVEIKENKRLGVKRSYQRLLGSTYDYDDGLMSVGKIGSRIETAIKSELND